jgi:hypothetical protein
MPKEIVKRRFLIISKILLIPQKLLCPGLGKVAAYIKRKRVEEK